MSAMNFPSSPSDGDIYHKWEYDASANRWVLLTLDSGSELTVTYSTSPPSGSGSAIGDEHYITSDGLYTGDVSAGYVWNGNQWTNKLYIIDGSAAVNDF